MTTHLLSHLIFIPEKRVPWPVPDIWAHVASCWTVQLGGKSWKGRLL